MIRIRREISPRVIGSGYRADVSREIGCDDAITNQRAMWLRGNDRSENAITRLIIKSASIGHRNHCPIHWVLEGWVRRRRNTRIG